MGFQFNSLPTPPKQKTGVTKVYIIPQSWITTFAEPDPLVLTQGATVLISDDHVTATGKGFIEMPIRAGGSEFTTTTEGETGSVIEKHQLDFVVPGHTIELLEHHTNAINERWLALWEDADCPAGSFWQMGCDCEAVDMRYKFGTGKSGSGEKAYAVTMTGTCTLMRYDGVIDVSIT